MDAPAPGVVLVIVAGLLIVAEDRVVALVVVVGRVAVLTVAGAVAVLLLFLPCELLL